MEHQGSLRQVEVEEVEKMLTCEDGTSGFSTYKCKDDECGKVFTKSFTCKSRICTHCGKKHADEWAARLSLRMFDVQHRHMVFTIAHTLMPYLEKDRRLWKVLMDSVNDTMRDFMETSKNKKGLRPGIICVLHPYGKSLNFNLHVHVIVTEGGLNKDNEWVDMDYFHYDGLRKVWQYHVLTNLKKALPKTREVRELIQSLFKNRKSGFYVRAKNVIKVPREVARYIGRYVRHPAIAESRLVSYDGDTVVFYYEVEKDDGEKDRIEVSMPVMEFIGRIIKFIPDRQFKMVRYYGLYSRRGYPKVKKVMEDLSLYNKEKETYIRAKLKEIWKIKCPDCGGEVELISKHVPINVET